MSERLPKHAIGRLLETASTLADDPSPAPPELERYQLGKVLGRGGMGIVYAAHDSELDRRVAVKLLSEAAGPSESARLRFLREARAAARLTHPNIATVYDATPEYIVMQLVAGRTLAEHPWKDRRELVALMRDAALAIHFAHGEGIVHRDLKPANLMVEERDEGRADGVRRHVYVMDFGLAKEREVDTSLSASGGVVGTPAYMAPEQASGDDVGPEADVYGLGATLYHCLAGRPPFDESALFAVLRAVVEKDPPPLRSLVPSVSADLELIVHKCMAKEPERRYASALALASDLDRWLRGEPVQARPPSVAYRFQRYVSRRQGAVVASLAVAGVALLVTVPLVLQARQRRDLAERVFALSGTVTLALETAAGSHLAGAGMQFEAHVILEEAIEECEEFLRTADVAYVSFFLGKLLHQQGKLDEARVALDRAIELDPALPGLLYERGVVLGLLYRERVPVFAGEELTPEIEEIRLQGLEDLRAAIDPKHEPRTGEELFAIALMRWLEGDIVGAVSELKGVIELDPLNQEAHLTLARIFVLLDDSEQAFAHAVIASDLQNGNNVAYVTRSQMRSTSGGMIPLSSQLLAVDGIPELFVDFHLRMQGEPSNANNYGFRGQVQTRRAARALDRGDRLEAFQNLELAVQELDSALTVAPASAETLLNRGACQALLDRLLSDANEPSRAREARDGAQADYDAALALDPELGAAYFDRGLLGERRAALARMSLDRAAMDGHLAGAIDDARAALARMPEEHIHRERVSALVERLER